MDYDLNRLHSVLLIIAKEIKRVCDNNGIKYSLIGGSLIGAVRHQGFIPWDDDMDFVMVREEYDKFRECCLTQLDPRFELEDWHTDKFYGNGFLKIMLKGTVAVELGKEYGKFKKEIFVDVFPFDRIPDDPKLRKKQQRITYTTVRLLQQKHGGKFEFDRKGPKKIGYWFLFVGARLYSREYLINKCESAMRQYKGVKGLQYTDMVGAYGYYKEIVDESFFSDYIEMKFEDTTFSVISGYDNYLRKVYGNYMELPPVDKRHTHSLQKVDFGPY